VTATAPSSLHPELTELLRTALNLDVPAPDTDLIATGRLDSMGMVELLVNLERRYGLVVDMRQLDIAQFRSVASIAEFVARAAPNGNGHKSS
jgi:acyl carrier protein